jgi:hypothetical protein
MVVPSTTTATSKFSRFSQSNIILQIETRLRVILSRLELDSELILDGEDRVVAQVLAVLVEDLRRELLVTLAADLQSRKY